jgi:hypothetical protein
MRGVDLVDAIRDHSQNLGLLCIIIETSQLKQ